MGWACVRKTRDLSYLHALHIFRELLSPSGKTRMWQNANRSAPPCTFLWPWHRVLRIIHRRCRLLPLQCPHGASVPRSCVQRVRQGPPGGARVAHGTTQEMKKTRASSVARRPCLDPTYLSSSLAFFFLFGMACIVFFPPHLLRVCI